MANGVSVSVGQLSDELQRQLKSFGNGVREDVKAAVDESAEELKKILRSTSPSDSGGKLHKKIHKTHYKSHWKVKQTGQGLEYAKTVHNDKKYQLSHLLEKGHKLRGGGFGGARVHIAPAEQAVVDKFYKTCESIIERKGGG